MLKCLEKILIKAELVQGRLFAIIVKNEVKSFIPPKEYSLKAGISQAIKGIAISCLILSLWICGVFGLFFILTIPVPTVFEVLKNIAVLLLAVLWAFCTIFIGENNYGLSGAVDILNIFVCDPGKNRDWAYLFVIGSGLLFAIISIVLYTPIPFVIWLVLTPWIGVLLPVMIEMMKRM